MRANIKLITAILIIWVLAVFGFHGLLKALETPTPEPAHTAYTQAWPDIKDNSATTEQKIALARTCLTLTGKYIDLRANPDLRQLFSKLVYDILPESRKTPFLQTAANANVDKEIDATVVSALGLTDAPLLSQMIPYTLTEIDGGKLPADVLSRIPAIMDKHLIHYRSVMTDTKVLGFPFHYFYTAVLLMIIFCLLCLIYCAKIDKVMINYGLEPQEAGR